jgi:YVTN family beta-propeller protein
VRALKKITTTVLLTLLAGLILSATGVFAQFSQNKYSQSGGSIFGMVIGPTKGNTTKVRHLPIENAAVEAQGPKGSYKTETGPHGNYSFLGIPAGEYTITVMKSGYETYSRQVVLEEMGMMNLDHITLVPDGKTPGQSDLIPPETVFITFAGIRMKSGDSQAAPSIRSKVMETGDVFKADEEKPAVRETESTVESGEAGGPALSAFENSLMAINPQDSNKIEYIRLAGNPTWLCFCKDGSKVYVADRKSQVSVYTAKQNYVKTGSISISSPAADVAADPDGKWIYVLNNEGITIIDVASDLPESNIELPPMSDGSRGIPKALACSPDGSLLYIALATAESGEVLSIDTRSKKVTAGTKVGADPSGIAVSPDGGTIFTADYGSNSVSILQASPLSLSGTVGTGSGPVRIAIAPNGKKVFVTNKKADTLSILSGTTFDSIETVKTGKEPLGVAVAADGLTAYTANSADGTVSIVDVKTCTEIRRIAPHPLSRPFGIAIKP